MYRDHRWRKDKLEWHTLLVEKSFNADRMLAIVKFFFTVVRTWDLFVFMSWSDLIPPPSALFVFCYKSQNVCGDSWTWCAFQKCFSKQVLRKTSFKPSIPFIFGVVEKVEFFRNLSAICWFWRSEWRVHVLSHEPLVIVAELWLLNSTLVARTFRRYCSDMKQWFKNAIPYTLPTYFVLWGAWQVLLTCMCSVWS